MGGFTTRCAVIYHLGRYTTAVKNKKQPLTQQVYQQLLEQLTDGRLKFGQVITRRGMAARLGVSMAPVAEAFGELERDGLLETMPRQGTRLRVFTETHAREQAVVRLALETQVARMVCGPKLATPPKSLATIARTLDARTSGGPKRWRAEIDFHLGLAQLTEQAMLIESLGDVLRLGFFIALQTTVGIDDSRRPSSRHGWLLKQLAKSDPDAAAASMRKHLMQGSMSRVIEGIVI